MILLQTLIRVGWLGLFLALATSGLEAQILPFKDNGMRRMVADSMIKELKEGVLVVRLKSYRNNLAAIDETLSKTDLSKRERKRWTKTRKLMVRDRDRFNKELVKGLHDQYDFSEFLVMYDTVMHQLLDGVDSGYFLNEDLEVDPMLALSGRPFAIIGEASRKGPVGEGVDGLVIYSSEMAIARAPFPGFYEYKSAMKTFFSLFVGSTYIRKSGESLSKRINDQLHDYYDYGG